VRDDHLRIGVPELRWRCPRRWVESAAPSPDLPTLLWGQERAVAGLRVLAGLAGRDEPHHLELTCPPRVGWGRAIAAFLARTVGPDVPVIVAERPSALALRGRGEPGLLHRADRGIVVVEVADLADDEKAWPALREAMSLGAVAPATEEDQPPGKPLPARLSAILVGPEPALKKLREADPRTTALLARRLDLIDDAPRDRRGVGLFSALLLDHARRTDLGEVSPGALRWLAEEAATGARRGRIPLRITLPAQALSEARLDRPDGALDVRDVRRSRAALHHRRAAREEIHRGRLTDGRLRLEVEGGLVGVANGLMVYGQGRQPYAVPGRISARVAVGREGLINVERESKFSGRSYDKGVFQLAGLLRCLFGQRSPLGLAATLVFEQSYGRVDGDSATLAETLALFSCLAELPCRQDVAVTGAISQRGEVLPIGSANLKIAGWWSTCRERGLTGSQGVLLPRASAADLQLPEEIVADVEAGRFHVWAAETVEQALELMLGRPAGLKKTRGFAPGSVYARAGRRMQAMSERLYPPRPQPRPAPKPPAGAKAEAEGPAPPKDAPKTDAPPTDAPKPD
jgi:predicted ATP-dependent protease